MGSSGRRSSHSPQRSAGATSGFQVMQSGYSQSAVETRLRTQRKLCRQSRNRAKGSRAASAATIGVVYRVIEPYTADTRKIKPRHEGSLPAVVKATRSLNGVVTKTGVKECHSSEFRAAIPMPSAVADRGGRAPGRPAAHYATFSIAYSGFPRPAAACANCLLAFLILYMAASAALSRLSLVAPFSG